MHTPNKRPQKQKSPAPAGTGRGFKSNNFRQQHDTKKSVPFGNRLQGQDRVLVFIGAHDGWDQARLNIEAGRDAVVLPVGEVPASRNWNCVRGRSIVVFELDDTGPGHRVGLVRTLAMYGAIEVFLIPASRQQADAVMWGVGQ